MLILHRREGDIVFGGADLDPHNPYETATHIYKVNEIRKSAYDRSACISVAYRDGHVADLILTPKARTATIAPGICLIFVGVHIDGSDANNLKDFVRIGFKAPTWYNIVRDNAFKKRLV